MELPPALRAAVDQALEGIPLADLARAASALSQRYRAEIRDGRFHLGDDLTARAYLATRLPAIYAAARAALDATAQVAPDFAPASALDVGAGPGTVVWAAADCWPSLADATLIEGSNVIRRWGEALAAHAPLTMTYRSANVTRGLADLEPHDLVTLSYVLDELEPEERDPLVDRLWALTAGMLVIVEPGRPAGWERILRARDRLIAAGAHIVAPCPHAAACPLSSPDWCHFARRVARSRVHRQAKGADVPWEDEKYIYIAASRTPVHPPAARIIAPPRAGSGKISLKLCRQNGTAAERLFTRRDGAAYKAARRLDWGDALSPE